MSAGAVIRFEVTADTRTHILCDMRWHVAMFSAATEAKQAANKCLSVGAAVFLRPAGKKKSMK